MDHLAKYLTGKEIVVTTVRNHWDAISSWWFLSSRYLPMYQFIDQYSHTYYARGKELWWLHKADSQLVFRYESLQQDLDEFTERLELPYVTLTKENVTKGKNKKYFREYYNKKSYQRVLDRFGEEIEYYGYLE